jgi:hypothetical protein
LVTTTATAEPKTNWESESIRDFKQ